MSQLILVPPATWWQQSFSLGVLTTLSVAAPPAGKRYCLSSVNLSCSGNAQATRSITISDGTSSLIYWLAGATPILDAIYDPPFLFATNAALSIVVTPVNGSLAGDFSGFYI
jgi:hypothetical protein